jgi:hypothetical protein
MKVFIILANDSILNPEYKPSFVMNVNIHKSLNNYDAIFKP